MVAFSLRKPPKEKQTNASKEDHSIAPIDLPRMVKFKPRRRRHEDRIPPEVKARRMFSDYIDYKAEKTVLPEIQLDTVIGRIGGKVIMTIHFLSSDFMIGLLLENKTSAYQKPEIEKNHTLFRDIVKAGTSFDDLPLS